MLLDYTKDIFKDLYDQTGFNFIFLYEQYEYDRFVSAIGVSIQLIIFSILLSLLVGFVGAWAQGSSSRVIRFLIDAKIQLFRNTPPLVQLLVFYFAIGSLIPTYDAGGYQASYITSFMWAVISLGIYAGAFNVEIFRSGIESIPDSTTEAAESLGFTRLQTYVYVIFPLALRVCLPALNNNLVNLLKTTTLAYAIAVPEMMYTANQMWSDNVNVPEMMFALFVYYLGLVGIFVWLMAKWEKHLRIPGFGQ